MKSQENREWEQKNPNVGENVEGSLGEVNWLKISARSRSLKQDLSGPSIGDMRTFKGIDEDHDDSVDGNDSHRCIDDNSVCLGGRDLMVKSQNTELNQAQVEEVD